MNAIYCRDQVFVNTDGRRRCYNGCFINWEYQWGGWYVLEMGVSDEKLPRRLEFWQELNDYAVKERGDSARSEFRADPEELLK